MKVTSLKPQKPLFPLPPAEGKLNNALDNIEISIKRKAGFLACLFLLCPLAGTIAHAQQWEFDETTRKAYELALNLQIEEALQLIPEPETAQEHYVVGLAEALDLLVSEDHEKFSAYEDRFHKRIDLKIKGPTEDYQFLHAELHLQWAFVYLKFGQEFDAGARLREAYIVAENCKRRSPDYLAIRKTTGLLELIIGSVPEKYNWLLSLLGMQGSIAQGLGDLDSVRTSGTALAFEADLLYSLVQGFVFQKPDTGFLELKKLLEQKPQNRLALFVAAALAIKNSQSEAALDLLSALASSNKGLPLYYADYLRGEVYLHKAEYLNAISSYRWFANHYQGQNYLKDAYYKMGLCYWLNGNTNDAMMLFKEARSSGREASEADKSAARSLADKQLPHVLLSKARYATDGGYYQQARELLNAIAADKDLPAIRDQVEYYYRKARLEHKTEQLAAARLFYQQTIDMAGEESWYFAPNACLQMGYILEAEKNKAGARNFFRKALTYKKHEYKNSIDSKAKSALARIQ
jgi:TolA-binding protein